MCVNKLGSYECECISEYYGKYCGIGECEFGLIFWGKDVKEF